MRAGCLLAAKIVSMALIAWPALAFLPALAAADVRVMCYGDSITAGSDLAHPESSYPGQLQQLRPDLEVLNEGQGGDISENRERFRAALASDQPRVVVLMLGTNDPVCNPQASPECASATATPERTVANLLDMAAEARRSGAEVVLLTPTPAVCSPLCQEHSDLAFAMAVRDAFTARVAEGLRRARRPAGVRIADLRRAFTPDSWAALSVEGLHPSPKGNAVIARFVAAQIERPSAARRLTGERADGGGGTTEPRQATPAEPDPFVRRPHGARDAP